MILGKKEALLIRSVIFSFLLRDCNDDTRESLQTLLKKLDQFLLNSSESGCDELEESDDDSDEEEFDDEEEVEELEVDELLPVEKFVNLPHLEVEVNGEKTTLEFDESDEEEKQDVILTLVGESDAFEVVALEIDDEKVKLHKVDGDVVEYRYTKLPKKWSRLFDKDILYGVGEDEGESEDDE